MNRLKSWPVWMFMGILVVAMLAVGSTRASGPNTQAERIDEITKRIACPTCDGESVYASRATAAEAIRNQVARDVAEGEMTDDEIVAAIASTYKSQILLVPRADGFDSLVWVLPIAVLACSIAGLWAAFRRWRSAGAPEKTEDDEELVRRLLESDEAGADAAAEGRP